MWSSRGAPEGSDSMMARRARPTGAALPGLLVRDPGGSLRYRANLGRGRLAEPAPLAIASTPSLSWASITDSMAIADPAAA